MSDRRYQTSLSGGIVVLTSHHRQLVDHVSTAIREARAGRRAWIKARSADHLDRFYAIEFRVVDGDLQITCFESALIINPDATTTPGWVRDVCTVARRIINPDLIPGAIPCPTP